MIGGPVLIGVHVHAEPAALRATLEHLRAHTPEGARLLLLPDGPDDETTAAVRDVPLPRLSTAEARGAPGCFNRLARRLLDGDEPVMVLLESGARVGPAWLERLLHALASAPGIGLAGPSTNIAWNEQCVLRALEDSADAAAQGAALVGARFGDAVRSLAPLHSIADFCLAVRREVVEAVGGADEGYGLGPCWEMDYAARAARAGFASVWACGAYVHRAPFSARRRLEEARAFEASRRRYQGRLCGRRLRGEERPYAAHCLGDGCRDFAPPGLVRLREPLPASSAIEDPPPGAAPPPTAAAIATPIAPSGDTVDLPVGRPAPPPPAPPQAGGGGAAGAGPFVTCIMPTRDRRALVPIALRLFLAQDHQASELLVIDDGDDAVGDLVPPHPRLRYLRLAGRRSVGEKRNVGCAEARGQLVAHWDDDDWYPPDRLSRQVAAIGDAALCGTTSELFWSPLAGRAFCYRYGGGAPPVPVGSSLLYRRDAWDRFPFPAIQIGEDVVFARALAGAGLALRDLDDPALVVGTLHEGNTSPKQSSSAWWTPVPLSEITARIGEAHAGEVGRALAPLVSCIMPTRDRRRFVELSMRAFRAQTWPRLELIVVDDGTDPVEDLVARTPGARHVRMEVRVSIGVKRNRAVEEAAGQVIVHWDDDDWYAPSRVARQAEPLLRGEADLSGLSCSHLVDLRGGDFWRPGRALHARMFEGDVHGGTLAVRRDVFLEGLRYPDADLAEDALLLRQAMARGRRLLRLPDEDLFVYVRHGSNAWRFQPGSFLDPNAWARVEPPPHLPSGLIDELRQAAGLA